jgi:DNA gyrase subunit A
LVGGLIVAENDEVIAIKASGQVTRSAVSEVAVKGRDTMGVKFVGVRDNDSVVAIALNPETTAEVAELEANGTDQTEAAAEDSDQATDVSFSVDGAAADGEAVEDAVSVGDASTDGARPDQTGLDASAPEGAEAEEDDSE